MTTPPIERSPITREEIERRKWRAEEALANGIITGFGSERTSRREIVKEEIALCDLALEGLAAREREQEHAKECKAFSELPFHDRHPGNEPLPSPDVEELVRPGDLQKLASGVSSLATALRQVQNKKGIVRRLRQKRMRGAQAMTTLPITMEEISVIFAAQFVDEHGNSIELTDDQIDALIVLALEGLAAREPVEVPMLLQGFEGEDRDVYSTMERTPPASNPPQDEQFAKCSHLPRSRTADMTWEPIETAPKDGTKILLFVVTPKGDPWTVSVGQPDGWTSIETGRWDGSWLKEMAGEPTHWMPLPTPPNVEER